jgi:cytochrome b subunit of formate dehydrogenase
MNLFRFIYGPGYSYQRPTRRSRISHLVIIFAFVCVFGGGFSIFLDEHFDFPYTPDGKGIAFGAGGLLGFAFACFVLLIIGKLRSRFAVTVHSSSEEDPSPDKSEE